MIDEKRASEIAIAMYNNVFQFCMAKHGCKKEEAEEITQEVFLLFWQKHAVLEDNAIEHWLFVVASNKIKELYRKKNREYMLVSLDELEGSLDVLFAQFDEYFRMSDSEILKRKDIILRSLKKKEFELYKKVYIEGKTNQQIAEELGIEYGNVKVRKKRLNDKLKLSSKVMFSAFGQFIIKIFF